MSVFDLFSPLPLKERMFVRARAYSAPLEELTRRAPSGRILDLGCGHGLVTAMLAKERLDRTVWGVDPDAAKVGLARQSVGKLPNVKLILGQSRDLLAELAGSFDAAVVADVLYLLPEPAVRAALEDLRKLLVPGGLLLLKEAESDGSWREHKALVQEQVMVKMLKKTKDSGGLGFLPREKHLALLKGAGFDVTEVVPLGQGYATPHVLFIARTAAAPVVSGA